MKKKKIGKAMPATKTAQQVMASPYAKTVTVRKGRPSPAKKKKRKGPMRSY